MRVVCPGVSRVDLVVLTSIMLLDELELNTDSQCCWAPGQVGALNIASGGKKNPNVSAHTLTVHFQVGPHACSVRGNFNLPTVKL